MVCGKICKCHIIAVNLDDEEKHWFVEFYRKLCRYGVSKQVTPSQDIQDSSSSRHPVSCFDYVVHNLSLDAQMFTKLSNGRKNLGPSQIVLKLRNLQKIHCHVFFLNCPFP